jgi:hypothetical protein
LHIARGAGFDEILRHIHAPKHVHAHTMTHVAFARPEHARRTRTRKAPCLTAHADEHGEEVNEEEQEERVYAAYRNVQ